VNNKELKEFFLRFAMKATQASSDGVKTLLMDDVFINIIPLKEGVVITP